MDKLQRSHVELKDIHKGEDVWVIASGPSMNFIAPEFFANKISIGVNRVNIKFDCDYVVTKDPDGLDELEGHQKRSNLIFSRWAHGNPGSTLNSASEEHWLFDHVAKPDNEPDISVVGTDFIVVSYSTITSAVHLAAYMGASNIILCGHDCGAINGKTVIDNYYEHVPRSQKSEWEYFEWLGKIEDHTIQVCEALKSHYDVEIHSLNPFINLNLEGNYFEPAVKQFETNRLKSSDERVKANRFGSSVEQFKDRLKEIAQLERAVAVGQSAIARLNQAVVDGQNEIAQLNQAVIDGQNEIAQLSQELAQRDLTIEAQNIRLTGLGNTIESYRKSWSWRITQPIRFLAKLFRRY